MNIAQQHLRIHTLEMECLWIVFSSTCSTISKDTTKRTNPQDNLHKMSLQLRTSMRCSKDIALINGSWISKTIYLWDNTVCKMNEITSQSSLNPRILDFSPKNSMKWCTLTTQLSAALSSMVSLLNLSQNISRSCFLNEKWISSRKSSGLTPQHGRLW